MKLGILIPTLDSRIDLFKRVSDELGRQIDELYSHLPPREVVSIIHLADSGKHTTGKKRNALIELAVKEYKPEYIAFFDDDDMPGPTYIKRGIEVAESGMDCGELWGQIYFNGKAGMPFHHYLGCTHAWQDDKKYHRFPNHLNFMKLDLIKDFKFQDKVFGEDMTWAEEINNAGVFKTMYPIPEIIYHYFSGNPKNEIK